MTMQILGYAAQTSQSPLVAFKFERRDPREVV